MKEEKKLLFNVEILQVFPLLLHCTHTSSISLHIEKEGQEKNLEECSVDKNFHNSNLFLLNSF